MVCVLGPYTSIEKGRGIAGPAWRDSIGLAERDDVYGVALVGRWDMREVTIGRRVGDFGQIEGRCFSPSAPLTARESGESTVIELAR